MSKLLENITTAAVKLALTVAAISANPTAYGLKFNTEKVHKGGRAHVVPLATMINTATFRTAFGDLLTDELMNGSSSFRVRWQGKARIYADANPTATFDAILGHCIEGILLGVKGVRGRTVEVVYRLRLGKQEFSYPLSVDAMGAILADALDQGFEPDTARDMAEWLAR